MGIIQEDRKDVLTPQVEDRSYGAQYVQAGKITETPVNENVSEETKEAAPVEDEKAKAPKRGGRPRKSK